MYVQIALIHHDCTVYEKCFYFLLKSSFSGKMVFPRKLKLIYPSTSKHYDSCSASTFLILFKKIVCPNSFKKEGRDYVFYMRELQRRDNKVIAILYDRFFIYRTVKSEHLKEIKKFYEK